jgi:hypothetical protein
MSGVRFEPIIPASERAKIVHALDRSATVTGKLTVLVGNVEVVSWLVYYLDERVDG